MRGAVAALALVAMIGLLAGCGGGSRQDANEKEGTYRMKVLHVSFPHVQAVARPARLEVVVRNVGTKAIPTVAVTVDSFSYKSNFVGLADRQRPIWVIERGPGVHAHPPVQTQEVSSPGGATTAYVTTWAFPTLQPGHKATFVWQVAPVKAGTYTLHLAYAAGLSGKAKTRLTRNSQHGAILVHIAGKPPATHVNPNTGKVAPGPYVPASEAESS
jgi:hypothetical protein